MRSCPADRGGVEIQRCREHRIVFDGVEEIRVAIHQATQTGAARKERVRCDHDARFTALQHGEIVEGLDVFGTTAEIEQQDVLALNRALDAGNQRNAPAGGVGSIRAEVELPIVKRDRQRVVPHLRRALDQLDR